MKKPLLLIWCLLAGLAIMPKSTFAGGFELYEHDARAAAMQNAFTAQANSPSAIYYNPAGMTQLEGTQLLTGANFYIPSATFVSDGNIALGTTAGQKTDLDAQNFLVPYLFLTHKLSEDLSVGLGGFANFGLGTQWADDWEGRYITGGTKAEVKTFTIEPALSYRLTKKISVGLGLTAQYFDVTLENKFPQDFTPPHDLSFKLNGDSWAVGMNAGLLVQVTDELRFGMNYRSAIKQNISGTSEFKGTALIPLATFLIGKRDAEADITLPANGSVGIAYEKPDWTVEADLAWTAWSSYDRLAVKTDPAIPGFPNPVVSNKNWKDIWAYRIGGEYRMDEMFSFRAGFSYEDSPVPSETFDPLLPTGNRRYYSLGVGAKFDLLTADLTYIYLDDNGGNIGTEVGNYGATFGNSLLGKVRGKFTDVTAHIICLNLRYQF
ncbi:MAG: transporter [Chlorobiales bacterium]|nr:transporter [Chlorobiales bacterium]